MPRLFVAVWPPEDVAEQLRALRRKDQRGVRFVPPENWHLTLRFLGEADPDEVGARLDAADLTRTTVRLAPAVDVLGRHSVMIPAAGLDAMAAAVSRATRGVGSQPERRRFVGHLTLARLHKRARLPNLVGTLFDATFTAEEVALVESRLRSDGAVYETIERWPTGSAGS